MSDVESAAPSSSGARSFKVVAISKSKGGESIPVEGDGGRYLSRSPAGAAKKAFAKIVAKRKTSRDTVTLIVTIQESTQGSAKKNFVYSVSRVKIDPTPVEYKSKDGSTKTMHFNFKTTAKSLNHKAGGGSTKSAKSAKSAKGSRKKAGKV